MPTRIEWADETWNPVTGCTKVSAGCKNCYAERQAKRFPRTGSAPLATDQDRVSTLDFSRVLLHPDRLDAPLRWRKPRRVFVCSMSDLFQEDVTDSFIGAVITTAIKARQHQFLILTKRPLRMQRFFARVQADRNMGSAVLIPRWPIPNLWLGVSVEDQRAADERIPLLLQTPAAVRFVSYEPALGPVDFNARQFLIDKRRFKYTLGRYLDWIICGGESGPGARPMHPDWARSARDQCAAAGVPFFFKQQGEWMPFDDRHHPVRKGDVWLWPDGESRVCTYPGAFPANPRGGHVAMCRVGKKAAGRLLDGELHDEWPTTEGENRA